MQVEAFPIVCLFVCLYPFSYAFFIIFLLFGWKRGGGASGMAPPGLQLYNKLFLGRLSELVWSGGATPPLIMMTAKESVIVRSSLPAGVGLANRRRAPVPSVAMSPGRGMRATLDMGACQGQILFAWLMFGDFILATNVSGYAYILWKKGRASLPRPVSARDDRE